MAATIGTALLSAAAGSAASTILGKVMSKKDEPAAPAAAAVAPTPEPTKVMPTADSDTVMAARKKSMITQAQRQGRASTILTSNQDSTDKLGG
jgi:hypothetical protein